MRGISMAGLSHHPLAKLRSIEARLILSGFGTIRLVPPPPFFQQLVEIGLRRRVLRGPSHALLDRGAMRFLKSPELALRDLADGFDSHVKSTLSDSAPEG